MPQLPLAEELCIGALHAELEELKKPQSGIFQMGFTIRRLKLAWAELETGMAIRDLEQAAVHFNNAYDCTDEILGDPVRNFRIASEAYRLQLYLPAFEARRYQQAADPDARAMLQAGLCTTLRAADAAPVHTDRTHPGHMQDPDHIPCFPDEEQRLGLLAKVAVELLGLRTGEVIYPASTREISTGGKHHSAAAHCGYVLEDDGKLPYSVRFDINAKVRGESTYCRNVSFGSVVRHAVRTVEHRDLSPNNAYATALHLVGAVAADMEGQEVSAHDRLLVEAMGAGFQRRLRPDAAA